MPINNNNLNSPVIGRFAPSPTGPLHFGSLVAATASYLFAKHVPNSKWLLRIEDLDSQRSQQQHTTSIISALEKYGFEWDDDITYQSERNSYYEEALSNLNTTYPCSCTRKFLKSSSASNGKFGYVYPGYCRNGLILKGTSNTSIRIKTDSNEVCFQDVIQGQSHQVIESDVGDFILKRADGSFAYQLAVVVDDYLQGINQVVRGADLFDNTPRQIFLQGALNIETPQYAHIPVAVTSNGKKLSKQNMAPEISDKYIMRELISALSFLGQEPLKESDFSNLSDLWNYSIQSWDQTKISKSLTQLYIQPKYE